MEPEIHSALESLSSAVHSDTPLRAGTLSVVERARIDGKFFRVGDERLLIKGVTYGTFEPDENGYQFPRAQTLAADFRHIASLGFNTVRLYTVPRRDLLDEAALAGLRVIVGVPWSQHVAFLDDRTLTRAIRQDVTSAVRSIADHPAVLLFALGNEIPAGVVRWHGGDRIERFLYELWGDAKNAAPESLFTYVNYPPTEFLYLPCFDVCAFNVYLHRENDLRGYVTRLHHIAGYRPLLLAEMGADSIREGESGQASIDAMHVRAAFEEGACGAVVFAYTDEWWRGGNAVEDWAFGLVDRDRQLKPAASAVAAAMAEAPFPAVVRRKWPRVSVVVCAYNAEETLEDCLGSLERLTYPDYEIILVNDGSRDATSRLSKQHSRVRVIDVPNSGLSAARNVGLSHATGEIVAYTDADVRADPDWLTYLVQPLVTSDVVGSGGPNIVPADDPPMAQCIARAPGGPTHVLLDDRVAEHVPGCNMAFRRDALVAIGGFNPTFLRAGDDVDVCWRLQGRGWKIGFAASALVWHHHRASIGAYWRQQVGYGEGERWLMGHHPEKFLDGQAVWHGRIYSPLPFVRSLSSDRINAGVWGTAPFPSVYRTDVHPFAFLPHSIRWQLISILLMLAGVAALAGGAAEWIANPLLAAGLVGIATTITRNLSYAYRSDVAGLPGARTWYRAVVALLHFLQPFARVYGQLRGILTPPQGAHPVQKRSSEKAPFPSASNLWHGLRLLVGSGVEEHYWKESWTTVERVLSPLSQWLRRTRPSAVIEIDEGWSLDRDVSLMAGLWAWLDVRVLVEDHGGKSLVRVGFRLRPTGIGTVCAVGLVLGSGALAIAGIVWDWTLTEAAGTLVAVAVGGAVTWTTAQAIALVQRGLRAVAAGEGLIAVQTYDPKRPLTDPSPSESAGQ
jgi:GT2 family glycosyltransferase